MSLSSQHPLYIERRPDWQQMRDTYGGQRIVKEKGDLYLKPTSGMIEDGILRAGDKGAQAYAAYKDRARVEDFVKEAVEGLIGVLWQKPPIIELPAAMEPLLENATAKNETLPLFLRRINEEQLKIGRLGVIADVIDEGENKGQPYLALYDAEDGINWDEGRRDGIEVRNLNLVVLDETGFERVREFEWEEKEKYRVLVLAESADDLQEIATEGGGEANAEPVMNLAQGDGTYAFGIFRDTDATFDPTELTVPTIRGNESNEIPFVFINTKDLVAEPDDPPLLGLSNIVLSLYRQSADYYQALHMQGQDTLVIVGGDGEGETRVGAGAVIHLTAGDNDAKYIGVDSAGLPEMRQSLENDKADASEQAGKLRDTVSRERESGEALSIRVSAKTATLNQIALTGAAGLERILRILAVWMGADPKAVIVTPNLEFVKESIDGKTVVEITSAKVMGAPLSYETIHEGFQKKGLTDQTFEDELKQIETEQQDGTEELLRGGTTGSTDEDGPENDEDEEEQEDGGGDEEEADEEADEQEAG